jgi:hypothetical protein
MIKARRRSTADSATQTPAIEPAAALTIAAHNPLLPLPADGENMAIEPERGRCCCQFSLRSMQIVERV